MWVLETCYDATPAKACVFGCVQEMDELCFRSSAKDSLSADLLEAELPNVVSLRQTFRYESMFQLHSDIATTVHLHTLTMQEDPKVMAFRRATRKAFLGRERLGKCTATSRFPTTAPTPLPHALGTPLVLPSPRGGKRDASAGNRTRGWRMASANFTTKPPTLGVSEDGLPGKASIVPFT